MLAAISHDLLNARTDLSTQRMLIQQAYEVLYRYAMADKVCCCSDVVQSSLQTTISSNSQRGNQVQKALRIVPSRIYAFAMAEIAFLVSLCSADGVVSLTACNCLRLMAEAERQPDAPQPSEANEDEVLKRHPIYEQLGDPKVSMIGERPCDTCLVDDTDRPRSGRVGHQKRVRKLMRLMTSPSAVHAAVWQELYFRWCSLTEMTVRQTFEQTTDGLENGTAPIGDKTISPEVRERAKRREEGPID